MPELPELEVVREVLTRRVVGHRIERVELVAPGAAIVARDLTGRGFVETLTGRTLAGVTRRGKFLIFEFDGEPARVVVNAKLTGRFQLGQRAAKRHKKTALVLTFGDGTELRYFDQKVMGQVYLTDDLARVPDYAGLGPEPFDVTLDEFRARLKPFRGEIKGILTRGEFLAGIGNAYADEILWRAQLHPYRKRTRLTPAEVERLYDAVRTTLREAIERMRVEIGERIETEPRAWFAVHMHTGEPCPRCGAPISLVSANQRVTNFCRTCQPGGLIRGMSG